MKLRKKDISKIGLVLAIISALLYAFNVIIEKKYIESMSSEMILFLMYLGAGLGLFVIHSFTKNSKRINQSKITKKEVPKVVLIVVCELLASFLIIEAVKVVNASLVSLLSIFEIIMTAIVAYLVFKEPIKNNELVSIMLMIIGCFILNFKSGSYSSISISSLLVIGACLFWGIENNITALISSKEPAFFTGIKCFSVSILYLIIVLLKGEFYLNYLELIVFGFFSYGLSILSYALSTKYLGANKSTIIFSFSPVFGVILAILIYKEEITMTFIISLIIMICALICLAVESKKD